MNFQQNKSCSPTLILLLLALFCFLPLTVAAQDRETTQDTLQDLEYGGGEVIDVHIVNVEVRVKDRQGNPVVGLSPEDFILREDGRKVEIVNFLEVPALEVLPQGASRAGQGAATQDKADSESPGTLVFLVDSYSVDRQNRRTMLDGMRQTFRSLDTSTQIAIAEYDGRLRIVEQLTNDRHLWLAAVDDIDEMTPGGLLRRRQRESFFREVLTEVGEVRTEFREELISRDDAIQRLNTLSKQIRIEAEQQRIEHQGNFSAMSGLIEALAKLPGRKALVYLSEGIPLHPGKAALQVVYDAMSEVALETNRGSTPSNIEARSIALGALDDQAPRPIKRPKDDAPPPDELYAVTALAARARVSFYPWKALGNLGGVSAEIGGVAGLGLTAGARTTQERNLVATLQALAEETGGKVAVGRDLQELVMDAVSDFGGYYSLGFSPESGDDDRLHKLKVKMRKRGFRVWHPDSYLARPAFAPLEEEPVLVR